MNGKVAFVALASLPAVAFLMTVLYAAYAATVVGHWPYYAHPDPKSLPDGVPHLIFRGAFLGGVLSLFVFPVVALSVTIVALAARRRLEHAHVAAIVTFFAGLGAWVAETWIRGGRSLLEWVLD